MKRSGAIMLAVAAFAAIGSTSPATGEVSVNVTELRSGEGVVLACLTNNPKAFPNCKKDPDAHKLSVPANASGVLLTFAGVKPGRYAVALLHDENENGKADRALGIMPKEGFGFSRDAKVQMGPPKFESAAFDYTGETTELDIRMRYLF